MFRTACYSLTTDELSQVFNGGKNLDFDVTHANICFVNFLISGKMSDTELT